VEAAAGVPFLEYLKENVLKPARMESTEADNQRAIIPNRTRWYSRNQEGEVINAMLADTSNKVPGGGLLSTSEDLIRFATAWESERLLKRATLRMQVQRQRLTNGSFTGYGLGWNITPIGGNPTVSHSGGQHGSKTLLAIFPQKKLSIAVMTNSDYADPLKVVELILKTLEAESTISRVQGAGGVITRPDKRP
jgi:CubicO group peptidase (beta-lactamase class C family)